MRSASSYRFSPPINGELTRNEKGSIETKGQHGRLTIHVLHLQRKRPQGYCVRIYAIVRRIIHVLLNNANKGERKD